MVTVPDPEEQDRRNDTPRPGGPADGPADGPMDTDAVFASIVANWKSEPNAPRWPADEEEGWDASTPAHPVYPPSRPAAGPVKPYQPDDEGHFEPPEPPPFPVPRPRTLGGVALLAVGVLILVQPSLLHLGGRMGTLLGLLALTLGIGWLVLGLRTGPPPDGWDDGARL